MCSGHTGYNLVTHDTGKQAALAEAEEESDSDEAGKAVDNACKRRDDTPDGYKEG